MRVREVMCSSALPFWPLERSSGMTGAQLQLCSEDSVGPESADIADSRKILLYFLFQLHAAFEIRKDRENQGVPYSNLC